jgi:hypothetical protein
LTSGASGTSLGVMAGRVVRVELDDEHAAALERVRRLMNDAEPGRPVSWSDALRACIREADERAGKGGEGR